MLRGSVHLYYVTYTSPHFLAPLSALPSRPWPLEEGGVQITRILTVQISWMMTCTQIKEPCQVGILFFISCDLSESKILGSQEGGDPVPLLGKWRYQETLKWGCWGSQKAQCYLSISLSPFQPTRESHKLLTHKPYRWWSSELACTVGRSCLYREGWCFHLLSTGCNITQQREIKTSLQVLLGHNSLLQEVWMYFPRSCGW